MATYEDQFLLPTATSENQFLPSSEPDHADQFLLSSSKPNDVFPPAITSFEQVLAPSSSSSVSKKSGKSRVENKLGEFFMHQIAHDASPADGGGFLAANAAVNTYSLRRTFDHIRLTGSFPL